MANMTTDVTPILQSAFPNGKPEMSAGDFDKAHRFVVGRKNGTVPKPGVGTGMDYTFWAHVMIVDWRMRVEEWEKSVVGKAAKSGIILPNYVAGPVDLICPQCEVKCVLDMTAGDVLVCPGGCHRAITVNTFVQLFKRPAQNNTGGISGSGMQTRRNGPISQVSPAPQTRAAALNTQVPKGHRPEDYGIFEKPKKGRTPLVGWRMWDIVPESMPRLQSLSNAKGTAWEPMVPQIGTCNAKDPSEITDHVCPSWEHRCGVHAVKELLQVKKWGAPSVGNGSQYVRLIGEIDLWGRVLEYSEGFRAEWGYPKKLYVPGYLPSRFDISPQELADMVWMSYLTEVEVNQSIFDSIP